MSKIPFNTLLLELENTLKRKKETGNSQNPLDDEVSAIISVYRHGRKDYQDTAKKFLIAFMVNAGYVKNKSSIGE